ncbi:MAG: hypothetical protein AAFP76_14940 [Bacteroidota bacterium]
MKILRLVLILGGLALVGWGVTDYFSDVPETNEQALPKIILGILGALAAILAQRRR